MPKFSIRKNGWKMTVEAKEGIKAENRKRSKKKLSDWIFNSKKNFLVDELTVEAEEGTKNESKKRGTKNFL